MDKYNRPRCICKLLNYGLSTFPAYLMSTAASVSLLLLNICADITELGLLIIRQWLLVRSLFVVLWLTWCFRAIPGNMSHLSRNYKTLVLVAD